MLIVTVKEDSANVGLDAFVVGGLNQMMFLFLLLFVGLGGEKDRGEEYSLFCRGEEYSLLLRAASYSGSAVLKMSSLDELSDSLLRWILGFV